MALTDKLNAIGDAIRNKTGKTDKMTLDQMPNEIASISCGGATVIPIIESLSVTENGTYTAPDGVDGYSPVTVNVPIPDGYIQPSGELEITKNGTHNVTEYASVNVNVPTGSGGGEVAGDPDLPEGYHRVDYIQFNGSQWIDTGIIGNQNTQISASFTWENSTQRHLFGCASADNTTAITSYMNGSWRFGNKSSSKNFSIKNPMLPYSVLVNSTTISTTNSITSISDVNEFETVGTLLLGGCRDSDGTTPAVGIVGKVFFFYLWQGSEQVLKLIPVTDGNGTYRFFNLVSKTFFDSITDTPLDGGNL